jgi:hypothetical protein
VALGSSLRHRNSRREIRQRPVANAPPPRYDTAGTRSAQDRVRLHFEDDLRMGAIIFPFLIYWLVLFVACYAVVEVAQDQLYDEVTPAVGLKVTLGSLVLAVLLTWLRTSLDTMFTAEIAGTLLQAIVWFAIFTLVFQFQPQHAVVISTITFLLVAPLASMGVDSFMRPSASIAAERAKLPSKPIRSPLTPPIAPPKAEAPVKAKAEAPARK